MHRITLHRIPRTTLGALCALTAAAGLIVTSETASSADSAATTFYADGSQEEFAEALAARGLEVDAAEDFEDARRTRGPLGLPILTGPPTGTMNDALDSRTSNQFFSPGQIPAALRFQSNQDNPGVDGPNPVGTRGLAISQPSSAGTHASPTTISSPVTGTSDDSTTSTDVIAVGAAHEAYVLDISLVEFSFVEPGTDPIGGPLEVRVFDEAGALLGTQTVDQEEIGPFFGVLAPEGSEIGRINIAAPTSDSELIHSVVAYDADGGNDTGTRAPRGNPLEELLEGLGL